ncbi:hypothetical protein V3C10_14445 [[Clostridium] symbiosum]|uniref:hypothetical protein n=1 Tax=Clostridium symbiosum TaxID=1512 RepID=UPI001D087836|nr:hypothetical protein [[Clostridium] symbiosum]MCB6611094.1 hypothetical protein [[Clostridium] symbiosum]MCB6933259.1 hypothetical protein [[Clostridium] symbiosum]
MSLTREDIQAIAGLIAPLETRMEAGFNKINERLEVLDTRVEDLDHRMENVERRMESVESRLDKLESDTASLKARQLSLRKDIKILDQKVQGTYELALEAWGKSTENRMLIQEI